jgi:transposase-like protein
MKTRKSYPVEFRADAVKLVFERRQMGIRCRQKRKFKATTHSAHSLPVAENVLGQVFEPSRPNEV